MGETGVAKPLTALVDSTVSEGLQSRRREKFMQIYAEDCHLIQSLKNGPTAGRQYLLHLIKAFRITSRPAMERVLLKRVPVLCRSMSYRFEQASLSGRQRASDFS